MKKLIISLGAVLVLATLSILMFLSSSSYPKKDASQASNAIEKKTNKTVTIFFDAEGFSPSSTILLKGDTVVFENGSSKSFWPASSPHPVHTDYPEKGNCGGSAFDACAAVPSGGTWSFTVNQIGEWRFHDHLNPNLRGILKVQE